MLADSFHSALRSSPLFSSFVLLYLLDCLASSADEEFLQTIEDVRKTAGHVLPYYPPSAALAILKPLQALLVQLCYSGPSVYTPQLVSLWRLFLSRAMDFEEEDEEEVQNEERREQEEARDGKLVPQKTGARVVKAVAVRDKQGSSSSAETPAASSVPQSEPVHGEEGLRDSKTKRTRTSDHPVSGEAGVSASSPRVRDVKQSEDEGSSARKESTFCALSRSPPTGRYPSWFSNDVRPLLEELFGPLLEEFSSSGATSTRSVAQRFLFASATASRLSCRCCMEVCLLPLLGLCIDACPVRRLERHQTGEQAGGECSTFSSSSRAQLVECSSTSLEGESIAKEHSTRLPDDRAREAFGHDGSNTLARIQEDEQKWNVAFSCISPAVDTVEKFLTICVAEKQLLSAEACPGPLAALLCIQGIKLVTLIGGSRLVDGDRFQGYYKLLRFLSQIACLPEQHPSLSAAVAWLHAAALLGCCDLRTSSSSSSSSTSCSSGLSGKEDLSQENSTDVETDGTDSRLSPPTPVNTPQAKEEFSGPTFSSGEEGKRDAECLLSDSEPSSGGGQERAKRVKLSLGEEHPRQLHETWLKRIKFFKRIHGVPRLFTIEDDSPLLQLLRALQQALLGNGREIFFPYDFCARSSLGYFPSAHSAQPGREKTPQYPGPCCQQPGGGEEQAESKDDRRRQTEQSQGIFSELFLLAHQSQGGDEEPAARVYGQLRIFFDDHPHFFHPALPAQVTTTVASCLVSLLLTAGQEVLSSEGESSESVGRAVFEPSEHHRKMAGFSCPKRIDSASILKSSPCMAEHVDAARNTPEKSLVKRPEGDWSSVSSSSSLLSALSSVPAIGVAFAVSAVLLGRWVGGQRAGESSSPGVPSASRGEGKADEDDFSQHPAELKTSSLGLPGIESTSPYQETVLEAVSSLDFLLEVLCRLFLRSAKRLRSWGSCPVASSAAAPAGAKIRKERVEECRRVALLFKAATSCLLHTLVVYRASSSVGGRGLDDSLGASCPRAESSRSSTTWTRRDHPEEAAGEEEDAAAQTTCSGVGEARLENGATKTVHVENTEEGEGRTRRRNEQLRKEKEKRPLYEEGKDTPTSPQSETSNVPSAPMSRLTKQKERQGEDEDNQKEGKEEGVRGEEDSRSLLLRNVSFARCLQNHLPLEDVLEALECAVSLVTATSSGSWALEEGQRGSGNATQRQAPELSSPCVQVAQGEGGRDDSQAQSSGPPPPPRPPSLPLGTVRALVELLLETLPKNTATALGLRVLETAVSPSPSAGTLLRPGMQEEVAAVESGCGESKRSDQRENKESSPQASTSFLLLVPAVLPFLVSQAASREERRRGTRAKEGERDVVTEITGATAEANKKMVTADKRKEGSTRSTTHEEEDDFTLLLADMMEKLLRQCLFLLRSHEDSLPSVKDRTFCSSSVSFVRDNLLSTDLILETAGSLVLFAPTAGSLEDLLASYDEEREHLLRQPQHRLCGGVCAAGGEASVSFREDAKDARRRNGKLHHAEKSVVETLGTGYPWAPALLASRLDSAVLRALWLRGEVFSSSFSEKKGKEGGSQRPSSFLLCRLDKLLSVLTAVSTTGTTFDLDRGKLAGQEGDRPAEEAEGASATRGKSAGLASPRGDFAGSQVLTTEEQEREDQVFALVYRAFNVSRTLVSFLGTPVQRRAQQFLPLLQLHAPDDGDDDALRTSSSFSFCSSGSSASTGSRDGNTDDVIEQFSMLPCMPPPLPRRVSSPTASRRTATSIPLLCLSSRGSAGFRTLPLPQSKVRLAARKILAALLPGRGGGERGGGGGGLYLMKRDLLQLESMLSDHRWSFDQLEVARGPRASSSLPSFRPWVFYEKLKKVSSSEHKHGAEEDGHEEFEPDGKGAVVGRAVSTPSSTSFCLHVPLIASIALASTCLPIQEVVLAGVDDFSADTSFLGASGCYPGRSACGGSLPTGQGGLLRTVVLWSVRWYFRKYTADTPKETNSTWRGEESAGAMLVGESGISRDEGLALGFSSAGFLLYPLTQVLLRQWYSDSPLRTREGRMKKDFPRTGNYDKRSAGAGASSFVTCPPPSPPDEREENADNLNGLLPQYVASLDSMFDTIEVTEDALLCCLLCLLLSAQRHKRRLRDRATQRGITLLSNGARSRPVEKEDEGPRRKVHPDSCKGEGEEACWGRATRHGVATGSSTDALEELELGFLDEHADEILRFLLYVSRQGVVLGLLQRKSRSGKKAKVFHSPIEAVSLYVNPVLRLLAIQALINYSDPSLFSLASPADLAEVRLFVLCLNCIKRRVGMWDACILSAVVCFVALPQRSCLCSVCRRLWPHISLQSLCGHSSV